MKRFSTLIFMLLLVVLLSACSEEERSFSIDQVKVDAEIQDDGVLQVQELYTYTFDGTYEGTTRSILSDVKDFKAYETTETDPNTDVGNLEELKVVPDDDDDQLLKIYTASENETKKVLYRYEVHNVVEKYSDVGDITYAFFDESNETDLKNVEIKIHSSEPISKQNFHVFLHANNQGELIKGKGEVQFKAQQLTAGETSEMRLILPADQLSNVKLTKDKKMGNEIVTTERELKSRRDHLNTNVAKMTPFLIGAIVLIILSSGYVLIIHPTRYRGDKNPDYLREVMEEYDPLFIQYIKNDTYLSDDGFVAGLLSLKQRGIVSLEEVPYEVKIDSEDDEEKSLLDKMTLRFTLVKEDADFDLADGYLIEWLFTEKDKYGRYFLLDSVIVQEDESDEEKEAKADEFINYYERWKQFIEQREDYQNLKSPYKGYSIYSIFTVLLSFAFMYHFTSIDVLTSIQALIVISILSLFSLGVLLFSRNKWVISAYYVAAITASMIAFTGTKGLIWFIALLIVSWILLLSVPATIWRNDIKKLKKAINVSYHEFKTNRYPIGSDPRKIERRLEYAIALDVGKAYGERCEKEEVVEKLTAQGTEGFYPLLNNPVMTTTVFDPTFLILYSSAVDSGITPGASTPSSTGGGGAGAF